MRKIICKKLQINHSLKCAFVKYVFTIIIHFYICKLLFALENSCNDFLIYDFEHDNIINLLNKLPSPEIDYFLPFNIATQDYNVIGLSINQIYSLDNKNLQFLDTTSNTNLISNISEGINKISSVISSQTNIFQKNSSTKNNQSFKIRDNEDFSKDNKNYKTKPKNIKNDKMLSENRNKDSYEINKNLSDKINFDAKTKISISSISFDISSRSTSVLKEDKNKSKENSRKQTRNNSLTSTSTVEISNLEKISTGKTVKSNKNINRINTETSNNTITSLNATTSILSYANKTEILQNTNDTKTKSKNNKNLDLIKNKDKDENKDSNAIFSSEIDSKKISKNKTKNFEDKSPDIQNKPDVIISSSNDGKPKTSEEVKLNNQKESDFKENKVKADTLVEEENNKTESENADTIEEEDKLHEEKERLLQKLEKMKAKEDWEKVIKFVEKNMIVFETAEGLTALVEAYLKRSKIDYMRIRNYSKKLLGLDKNSFIGNYAMSYYYIYSSKPDLSKALEHLQIIIKSRKATYRDKIFYYYIFVRKNLIYFLITLGIIIYLINYVQKKKSMKKVGIKSFGLGLETNGEKNRVDTVNSEITTENDKIIDKSDLDKTGNGQLKFESDSLINTTKTNMFNNIINKISAKFKYLNFREIRDNIISNIKRYINKNK